MHSNSRTGFHRNFAFLVNKITNAISRRWYSTTVHTLCSLNIKIYLQSYFFKQRVYERGASHVGTITARPVFFKTFKYQCKQDTFKQYWYGYVTKTLWYLLMLKVVKKLLFINRMWNDSHMTDNTYSASAIASTEKEEFSCAHARNKEFRTSPDFLANAWFLFFQNLWTDIVRKMFLLNKCPFAVFFHPRLNVK